MPPYGSNVNHRGQWVGAIALCLLLLATLFVTPSVKAEDGRFCSLAIDFGDGRIMWTDVPLSEGMNGFDVFLNGTAALHLSESHSPTPPYGHTVIRVDDYSMEYDFANPANSGRVWHLWYWDMEKSDWSSSNTLVDGIDPTTTPAILFTYHQDPWGPPTIPLEHEVTTPDGSSSSTLISFDYQVNGLNVAFDARPLNETKVSNYTWIFGDGESSRGKNVNHSYPAKGNYLVTLQVSFFEGAPESTTKVVNLGSTGGGSDGFPIWGWGVLALALLAAADVAFLYRKRLKRIK